MKYKNGQTLLKIGEVAKLNHISADALRYYDKINLFKPAVTDENGYRYYAVHQMLELDLIIWLRMNGTPVQEIRQILEIKSLDKVIEILSSENKRLIEQIQKLQDQLYANRYYISQMKKCTECEINECYFLEFENRYYISSLNPEKACDRDAYELALKNIFQGIREKDTYFNSFFGGIYHYDEENAKYRKEFYPAVVNIRNRNADGSCLIPKGIYAVMSVQGYFDHAYDMISSLQSFIREEGFSAAGDCYVLKIWERGNNAASSGEMMELQIPVLKCSI